MAKLTFDLRTGKKKPRQTGIKLSKGKCLFLGERVEFRAGCGGWNCLHECNKAKEGNVVVQKYLGLHPQHERYVTKPGDECQDCPSHVPAPAPFPTEVKRISLTVGQERRPQVFPVGRTASMGVEGVWSPSISSASLAQASGDSLLPANQPPATAAN